MLAEAEPCAEGETHEPIGAEMADHRRARVAQAAESAGGDGLDAVKELESGASGEKDHGVVDGDGIVGVEGGDVLRDHDEDDAHYGHERGAEGEGGVAGAAGAGGAPRSVDLAKRAGPGGG